MEMFLLLLSQLKVLLVLPTHNIKKQNKNVHPFGWTLDVGISLFFRAVTSQVFSAPLSLTSVFGMGTGGPSASSTPTILFALSQENS